MQVSEATAIAYFKEYENRLGSLRTSPYNSPSAQCSRLLNSRRKYFEKCSEAADHVGVSFFWCILLFILGLVCIFQVPALGYPMMTIAIGLPTSFGIRYFFLYARVPDGKFTCPLCKAPTPLYATWICGHCKTSHSPIPKEEKSPTWLEACSNANCRQTPHSLSCFKCSEHIVFAPSSFYKSPTEIAYLQGYPPTALKPPAPVPDRPPRILSEHLR